MRNIFILLICSFIIVSCQSTTSIQPASSDAKIDIGGTYKEIELYIKGEKKYQDLSDEAQKLYINKKSDIVMVKQLLDSDKISGDQVMQYLMKGKNTKHSKVKTYRNKRSYNNQYLNIKEKYEGVHEYNKNHNICYRAKYVWIKKANAWLPRISRYNDADPILMDSGHPAIRYLMSYSPPAIKGKFDGDEHYPWNISCDIQVAEEELPAMIKYANNP